MKFLPRISPPAAVTATLLLISPCQSFVTPSSNWASTSASTITDITNNKIQVQQQRLHKDDGALYSTRRSFFTQSAGSLLSGIMIASTVGVLGGSPQVANALPSISVLEFESILKESAKSIQGVAMSGPKSETAIVTLMDGTQFGISDLYESPTDPRSPLKLVATCRSYNVPTKIDFPALSDTKSKKKVVYMNQRVRDAAEKEKAKKERMEQDEVERLAELEAIRQSSI
jgi:hypothetical protein